MSETLNTSHSHPSTHTHTHTRTNRVVESSVGLYFTRSQNACMDVHNPTDRLVLGVLPPLLLLLLPRLKDSVTAAISVEARIFPRQ